MSDITHSYGWLLGVQPYVLASEIEENEKNLTQRDW
jgi:hypothetical protein